MKKNLLLFVLLSLSIVACNKDKKKSSILGTVYFAPGPEITVGNQVWSQPVMATGCRKTDFISPDSEGDCRCHNKADTSKAGDYFSAHMVHLYADELCPDPWNLPMPFDFMDLDTALGGNGQPGSVEKAKHYSNYFDVWDARYTGYTLQDSMIFDYSECAVYWAQTFANDSEKRLRVMSLDRTFKRVSIPSMSLEGMPSNYNTGFTVRCVKPK